NISFHYQYIKSFDAAKIEKLINFILFKMMHFTEEQLMIRKVTREFAEKELLPGVVERDKHAIYPRDEIRKMQEAGFMGMLVDLLYGGGGMDTLSYVLAIEEISKKIGRASCRKESI